MIEEELILSAVVANNRMNRERNATGVNSYEKDLDFHPVQYLQDYIERFGQVKWLDLCCGEGRALLQCALNLDRNNLQHRATLKGIDLIAGFQPIPSNLTCLQLQVGSVVDWTADDRYDFITCVHGLHYVGDKLLIVQSACRALTAQGVFMAHLDLQNIKISNQLDNKWIIRKFRDSGLEYNPRKRILFCKGPQELDFGLRYQGACDKAGPNYTRQDAVASYYIQRRNDGKIMVLEM